MADQRIVYGVNCTWWDSIDKVATIKFPASPARFRPGPGLPCCPNCGSVLMEVPDEASWVRNIDSYVKEDPEGRKDYRAMMEWARGRCFATMAHLKRVYAINAAVVDEYKPTETPAPTGEGGERGR